MKVAKSDTENPIMTNRMEHSADHAVSATDPDPVIEAYKKSRDRTLIRDNLRLTENQHGRLAKSRD